MAVRFVDLMGGGRGSERSPLHTGLTQAKPRGRSPGDTGAFLELKPTARKRPIDDKKMSDGPGS